MNNYNDLADMRGTSIPMFNQHGTALSQEERQAIAKKKGVCVKCGIRTHEVKMFKRSALTTDHAYEGKCIRCNPHGVPYPIVQAWEQKFEPKRNQQSSNNTKFRVAARVATLSHSNEVNGNGHQVPPTGANRTTSGPASRTISAPASRTSHLISSLSSAPASRTSHVSSSMSSQRGAQPKIVSNASESHNLRRSNTSDSASGQIRPRAPMVRSTNSYSPSNSASELQVSPKNATKPVVTVGSDVMMNEDYTGSKSREESWRLMGALRDSKDHPDKLRPRLHRIRNIGNDQEGIFHEIKELIEAYMTDARMMTVTCGALWGITARSDSLKIEACESGAVGTMVHALKISSSQEDQDFVLWAIGTISCLSHEIECRRYIADDGGIEIIVESMKRHPLSAGVFEWSSRALCSLVFETEGDSRQREVWAIKNIESFTECDGIAVLVSSMNGHAGESVAQLWAIKLLWILLDCGDKSSLSESVTKSIIAVGGISTCSRILRNRSTTALLFEETASLLYSLLLFAGSDGNDASADCMVTTIRKMSENPDEIELQEACCNLLSVLAPANRLQFKDSKGINAIVIAMAGAIDSVTVQRAAINVLWSISYIQAFFDFSYLEDSLGAVAIAKERHPHDVELLVAACGFVANVATYSAVTASGIQYEIPVHALGLSDNDPRLQDQASRALGNICIYYPHLMKQIVDSNGIKSLVQCLNSKSLRAVQSICAALSSIANASEEYKQQIIAAGCMDAAKRLIQRSVAFSVTENALELLSALSSSMRRSSITMPCDIFQVILQAMRTQMTSTHELELTCNVIANLLAVTTPGSTTVDFSSLVEYMTDLIKTKSLSIDLKRSACDVLWALCARQTMQPADSLADMFTSILGMMRVYKGDEEPYHSGLQSTGAGALVALTSCVNKQNVHMSADDVETIMAVTYMVMEFDPENNDLLEQFLEILLNLSFASEGLVIQCGGIVVVIDAMVERENVEAVQEKGCAILSLLSSTENLQVNICIAETDGIDMIVSALAVFTGNERIQVHACSALSHLSVDHESRMLIASLGGLILICNSMNNYLDNLELLEGACSALLNLSSDADQQILADSSIAEAVINAMRRHPDATGLHEKALGVLQNFSMRNRSAKETIAQAGGIDTVTSAIRDFMGTSAVVERAFSTMWSLAVLEQNQIDIADADGIGLVVNGMMANIDHVNVQKQACGCLCTLSSNSRNKAIIREEGGVDAILFAMWAHFDSEVLQIEACRALSSLAVNVQTNEVMIATDGEINAIISAMRLFPESPKLQEHACVAMRNFMLSQDNVNLIRASATELTGLLTKAAMRFPTKCSERANQVLANL